jgi:hypothetical protein
MSGEGFDRILEPIEKIADLAEYRTTIVIQPVGTGCRRLVVARLPCLVPVDLAVSLPGSTG